MNEADGDYRRMACILSPTLFNIYTNDQTVNADDLCITAQFHTFSQEASHHVSSKEQKNKEIIENIMEQN